MERRVLTFSRDADFIDLYTIALDASAMPPVPVRDAAHLTDILVQHPFAVAIVDVLGDVDWQAVSMILERGIPTVIVTGWWSPNRGFRDRAFAAGAAAFVVKPIAPPELVAIVRRVLGGERGIDALPTSR